MSELVREPIGLRVLMRALRPEDREPFLLWRSNPQAEADALVELGQDEDQALLWASLLRWSEAERAALQLGAEGWEVTLHGVRAIVLARALGLLQPPAPGEGWEMVLVGLPLRAVPEQPRSDDQSLARLLAFLEE